MSPDLLEWIESAHVFAVILWIAGLVASLRLIRAHAAGGGEAAVSSARGSAVIMDIGATLAILSGLTMILGSDPSPMSEGWLHAKLGLVVLGLFALHGITRAKIAKARRGGESALHPAIEPVAIALAALLAILAVAKPM